MNQDKEKLIKEREKIVEQIVDAKLVRNKWNLVIRNRLKELKLIDTKIEEVTSCEQEPIVTP